VKFLTKLGLGKQKNLILDNCFSSWLHVQFSLYNPFL
jgi:hypothetical protein